MQDPRWEDDIIKELRHIRMWVLVLIVLDFLEMMIIIISRVYVK